MKTKILYTQNYSLNNCSPQILSCNSRYLTKDIKFDLILKRDMQSSSSRDNFSPTIIRNNLDVVLKINSNLASRKKADQTHFPKKIITVVCPQEGCKTTNCVQGTEKTNPCGKSPQFHKQLFTDQVINNQKPSQFSNELMGSFTHKIPANKTGVFINHTDSNDTGHPQYLVTEKAVLYVDSQIFKENKKITSFCQQNYTTNNVIANAPLDSVTVMNDPNTKIIKYTYLPKTLNNIPTDDGF